MVVASTVGYFRRYSKQGRFVGILMIDVSTYDAVLCSWIVLSGGTVQRATTVAFRRPGGRLAGRTWPDSRSLMD
jgi:hypothetical protein